ncbi:LytR/AlgR family response regulator transcription factor [Flavicella marina]|uniref:LytR/AlgR family response regulator transcription factor n=1 Tax=Flavicella marina TaxID=1475951 RepID=UPI00126441DB|nr:LytTR family DNA-binding domain-containing protein [Flavicella marina]
MLKILIIDDEKDALEVLEWKLKTYITDVSITTCSSPKKALEIIPNINPNLVFLDVQMPEMNGFSFLEKLPERDFQLIFTTAFDEFALQAIKNDAVDYLLKPIDKEDLILAVEKARKNLQKNNLELKMDAMLYSMGTKSPKINISADGKIYFLEEDDVVMLQSDKSYTTIYLVTNKKIIVSKTLKEVEKKFQSRSFYRVHNSYLINLSHVKEYLKRDGGELILTNELTANVSRNKKNELIEKLQLNV